MGFGKFLLKATKGLSLILGNENGGNDLGKKAAAIIIGIVIGVIVTIVAVMDYIIGTPMRILKNFFFGEDIKIVEEYKNDEALNNSFGRTNFKYEDLIIEHNFANEAVKALISEAKSHLGKPYLWGATGPTCFDCSGYVVYCLRKTGIREFSSRPNCRMMWSDDIIQIKADEVRTGDLIFFSGNSKRCKRCYPCWHHHGWWKIFRSKLHSWSDR